MKFAWLCSHESYQPEDLVDQAVAAEEAGFDAVLGSDHFHPWVDDTSAAGFVWSWLGAVAVKTQNVLLGTAVTPRPGGHVSELGRDGELDFRLLAVAPSARRRGIGRTLVEHIITLAAERGAVRVVMNSGPDMIGAHQLYYSMGFTRLTERETRTVEGHSRPLLAFGYEVGHGTGL